MLLAIAVCVIAVGFAIHHHAAAANPTQSSADGLLNRPASFTYIDRGDVSTLDLNRMSWLQDIRIGENIFEGLYKLDPKTLACIPGVAQIIDAAPDKMHFTFHLRQNAKWSNGDPVTSADFLFAWRRMLEEPGDYTYLLHYIKGAEAYEDAFAKDIHSGDFSTVGVAAPDPSTLQVTLSHPLTFFPDLCAFVPFYPLNQKSMEPFKRVDAAGRATYDEHFTLPGNLVSNGAYQLSAWTLKVGMRLDANPNYWDAASVHCPSVLMIIATEPLIGWRKYENHEVDWLAEPNAEICAGCLSQHRPDLHLSPSNGTYYYSFNCQKQLPDDRNNPLFDVRVRRALSMVIDRKPIVEKISRCGERPSNDYVPPGIFPTYDSPKGLPFDIPAARKLLTDAGYPGGRGFPPLSLLYNTDGDHKIIAEYISRQWKNLLNLDIAMDGVEIAEFRQRLHNKKYAIARASWYGDYNDLLDIHRQIPDRQRQQRFSSWSNREYDDLCAQATVEPDEAKRTKAAAAGRDGAAERRADLAAVCLHQPLPGA